MVTSRAWLYTSITLVAFAAVWIGYPQRELDWPVDLLPMARAKMYTTSTDATTPLDGVVIAITGATSGIGLSLTKTMSKLGATVIALGRSPSKLTHLQDTAQNVVPIVADLNDLQSVSSAADEILDKFDHVDMLINNAGMHYKLTLEHPSTPQGYDQVFVVNYLSHFLLTEKLIPLLQNSTHPTLIEMSSTFHWAVDGSDLVPSNGEIPKAARPGYHSIFFWRDQRAYANSKLAQILNMRALQRRFSGIRMVSVCPGWVGTQIAGEKGTWFHSILNNLAFDSDGWGLSSTLHAMLDTSIEDDFYISSKFPLLITPMIPLLRQPWAYTVGLRDLIAQVFASCMILGQKFVPQAQATSSSPESYNVTLQEELYTWSKQAIADYV